MAIIKNNMLTAKISGMVGRTAVYKQLRGKTILAARPRKPRCESDLQRKNRLSFRTAAAYAKAAMLDPQKKEYFWKMARKMKLPNAYTAAISAYRRAEKINNGKPTDSDIFRGGYTIFHPLKVSLMAAFLRILSSVWGAIGSAANFRLMSNLHLSPPFHKEPPGIQELVASDGDSAMRSETLMVGFDSVIKRSKLQRRLISFGFKKFAK